MKVFVKVLAWFAVIGVALFAALNPDGGVVYQSPAAALGLAMIGIGLARQVRQRQPQTQTVSKGA